MSATPPPVRHHRGVSRQTTGHHTGPGPLQPGPRVEEAHPGDRGVALEAHCHRVARRLGRGGGDLHRGDAGPTCTQPVSDICQLHYIGLKNKTLFKSLYYD